MNKKKLITMLLVVVGILMITFFVMDWLVFYRCGAVEQCLVESSNYQNIAKFAVTGIMTVIVFFIGGNCLCRRDRNFLQAGFAMALCADFCLKILHNYSHFLDHRSDYTLLGICFFMVVQALFIYRHTRMSDTDKSSPWILCIPFGVMFVANALHLFSIFEGPTVPIVATYGAFLICSLIVACKVPKMGYFPEKNARNIKRGMILFFCCDACVGISLATGDDHSVQEIVATVANNFVWYFYTPALILLGLSGYKRKE
jgi:hypothetical protein